MQACSDISCASPAPVASPSAPPIDTTANPSALNTGLTYLLNAVHTGVAQPTTIATNLAVQFYVLIAVISISWAALFWHWDGSGLPEVARNVISRLIETSVWIAVISTTWTGFGGNGWFGAIINAGASLGGIVAGQSSPVNFASGTFTTNNLPGTILDFGFSLFTTIMGANQFGKGGFFEFAGEALNGSALINACVWVAFLASAVWAVFICAYSAFRLFCTLVKCYLLAPLTILQAFAGSRRTSSMGSTVFSGSLLIGIEVFIVVAGAGLGFNTVLHVGQAAGIVNTNTNAVLPYYCFNGNAIGCASTGYSNVTLNIGTLLLIDLVLTLMGWVIRDAPQLAADVLAGRFSMTGQQAIQILQSSPSLAAKSLGWAGGAAQAGAAGGAGAGVNEALKPMKQLVGGAVKAAGMVALGVATGGTGLAAVATAAGRGGMIGGTSGALLSGFGKAALGGIGDRMRGDKAEEQNSVSGAPAAPAAGSRAGARAESGAANAAGASEPSDRQAARQTTLDDNVTQGAQDVPDSSVDAASSEVTRTTTIDEQVLQRLSQAAAAMERGATAMAASAAGGGSQPRSQNSSGFDPLGELDSHMSIGKAFMYKALYQSARPQTPPTPIQEQSQGLTLPLFQGNR